MGQPLIKIKNSKAFCEGVQAAIAGAAESANPFDGTGDVLETAWDMGHRAGQGVSAIANTTAYTVGQLRSTGGEIYCCVVAGTTGTGTRPSGTGYGSVELDGSVSWEWMGTGSAIDLSCASLPASGPPFICPESLRAFA